MTSTEDGKSMTWLRQLLLAGRHLDFAESERGRVRLQTLVLLRWMAIAGQLVAVLFVNLVLGFPLPLGLCLAAIAASAWLNVFLTFRYPMTMRLPEWQAAIYFAIDLMQLAVLLFLTGGLQNPFALLFMAPVTISATTLSLRSTAMLLALSFIYVTLLAFFHMPLPWYPSEPFKIPSIYLLGTWSALLLGLGFMAAYAWRISQESKRMSAALAATQFVLARAQRLSALDGLAAAAAHELGTPLGTIALVTKELQRGGLSAEQMKEDLSLLSSQAARCKEILSKLSKRPDEDDAMHSRLALHVLLDEIVDPHRGMDIDFRIGAEALEGDAREPDIWRKPEILYGLGNFVENAADFARSVVEVTGRYDQRSISVTIIDDGPGLSPDVMERLGEPYVTTRPRRDLARDEAEDPNMLQEGMGLGVFIGKTLLERSGARVEITNRRDGRQGAQVKVSWRRDKLEAPPAFSAGGAS